MQTSEGLRSGLTKAGLGASHVVAGLFISLFALFFFLFEGARIWAWVVRLFPRTARERVAGAGEVAWTQLTAFTRATILVALVDAVGITVVALLLQVPFAPAIGAIVFLGAFIPIVGALASGMVAVLLALCLLYTSDAADERSSVDLGGRRVITKKTTHNQDGRA